MLPTSKFATPLLMLLVCHETFFWYKNLVLGSGACNRGHRPGKEGRDRGRDSSWWRAPGGEDPRCVREAGPQVQVVRRRHRAVRGGGRGHGRRWKQVDAVFYLFAMRMEGFSFLQETTFVALGFFLNSLFLELYDPPYVIDKNRII